MGNMKISGTADITHEGIKKHFTKWKKDPFQAINELIANGFDAGAKRVDVIVDHNDLHGLESVTVLDNGSGIDINHCDLHFSKFNESSKHGDDDAQGAHGKGRLAFHLLCSSASWFTRYKKANSIIKVESQSLRNFTAEEIDSSNQHALLSSFDSGTCVVLEHFKENLPGDDEIRRRLETYFGWRLGRV